MNIRDIEETIHTLETRHPGLNETMLLTLLRAGGWEDKDIITAKTLFRSSPAAHISTPEPVHRENLPALQEVPVFEPASDEDHMIEAPHGEEIHEPLPIPLPAVPEPESLIQKDASVPSPSSEEFPHNLPLRPFETSEHIWPFSRYKDIFYGEDDVDSSPVQQHSEVQGTSPVQKVVAPSQMETRVDSPLNVKETVTNVVDQEPLLVPLRARFLRHEIPEEEKKVVIVEKTGDEKLVIMACIMLLAILLLLGYMYSNGRL